MVYFVTGVASSPSTAPRAETRHTAQGAHDLAAAYLSSGVREVEVRDGEGNLRSLRELERAARHDGGVDTPTDRRLAN